MSKPINWIKLSSRRTDQTTENNLQERQSVCSRESEEAKGMNKNQEKNCYSQHESELKTTHHKKLLRLLIYLTVIHLLFPTKQMASLESMLRFLMPALRKKAETKHRRQPKREYL